MNKVAAYFICLFRLAVLRIEPSLTLCVLGEHVSALHPSPSLLLWNALDYVL